MGKLGYRPALDGVRAVSIALVLAFHLGAPWMPGGYLGVSVFFTLSGFLITSLLLGERATTGRIDIRSFYVRRLRRLLPASLVCLTGIAVLAAVGTIAARSDLRSGVLGAVLQVANWERLLGDKSYADLFLAPSPVDHFWSLAIEEQFYWVWPVAVAGLTAVAARRVAHVLVGTFVVLSVGALVTAQTLGGDAAYFASWARFAEILAGAALAALVHGRQIPARAARLALPCLAVIVVLAVITPAGRGWAYSGGLPLFSLVSAGLLLGLLAPGPVERLLAREPIPWIGRISYGLYLFHWPVFTILGEASVGEKLAMTFGLTVASYYLIERPIRIGRVLPTPSIYLRGAAAGFIAVAAVVAALVPDVQAVRRSPAPTVIAAVGAEQETTVASTPPATSVPSSVIGSSSPAGDRNEMKPIPTTSTTAPPSPAVVALFGDSLADWLLRDAAPTFARTDVTLVDAAIEGCDGAVDAPPARHRSGAIMVPPEGCGPWPETYPLAAERADLPLDVAVLLVGNKPIVDHKVGPAWISPCIDMRWYVDDIAARIAYLGAHAERVVLALPSWGGRNASFFATDDHLVRTGCVRAQLSALASKGGVEVVDLAAILCPEGPESGCAPLRKDGLHIDAEHAPTVLEWILDRVV